MTPRVENLTITSAELAACQPIAGEGGHVLRALCPFHGSDHQRSLRVTVATGRFAVSLRKAASRWRPFSSSFWGSASNEAPLTR